MRPEDKYTDDLEYLSQLGYEKVPAGLEDMDELKTKARSKTFSYNPGIYFNLVSLLTGAFLGISVFFYVYNAPPAFIHHALLKNNLSEKPVNKNYTMQLDTFRVSGENFVKPLNHKTSKQAEATAQQDTAMEISSLPMSTTLSSIPEKITEAQIKYIPNSPIIFLHDLKITDYSTLYFRQNKFVTLTVKEGLDASYANPSEAGKNPNILSPNSYYYLHQAISDAMLYFSRKEYTRCLNTLEMILEINPTDINCKFYSGMCNFYKKNYKKAQGYFDDCINNTNNSFLNEALFYKACSLYQSGETGKAQVIFKEIAEEGSFYSAKAKQFVE